ncbi:MAG: hypothetical protein AB7V42_14285 [Thermoleophilia bacterium]
MTLLRPFTARRLLAAALVACVAAFAGAGTATADPSQVITTVAGDGVMSFTGDGGPATDARIALPRGVAVAADGSVLIADYLNSRIRRVSGDGIISTAAGTDGPDGGDGGPAVSAAISMPWGVAAAADGSFLIPDTGRSRVRRVGADGVITTVAGTGVSGNTGDGGPATAAQLSAPAGVAVAPDGTMFVSDYSANRVRRIAPDGTITAFAGTGTLGFAGDGGPAAGARLSGPWGLALGPDGSLYIADMGNGRIRRVAPDGTITTFAGSSPAPAFSGDGGPAPSAELSSPTGVAVAPDGSVFIADNGNGRIRKVAADGTIATIAGGGASSPGDGGPASAASLSAPAGVAVAPGGSILLTDTYKNRIRRVTNAWTPAADPAPAPAPPPAATPAPAEPHAAPPAAPAPGRASAVLLGRPVAKALSGGRVRVAQRIRFIRGGRYTFIYTNPATGRRILQLPGSRVGPRLLSRTFSAPVLVSRSEGRTVVLASIFPKKVTPRVRKAMRLRIVLRHPDGTLQDATLSG